MDKALNTLKTTRQNILKVIDNLSTEELNKIPKGFNNNIIWNVAHCSVTHQLLTYLMSGNTPKIDQKTISDYRKGSKPEKEVSSVEIDQFKKILLTSVDDLCNDLEKLKSSQYQSYTTSFGIELESIEDAINFLNIHEGIHFGYILALKRAL